MLKRTQNFIFYYLQEFDYSMFPFLAMNLLTGIILIASFYPNYLISTVLVSIFLLIEYRFIQNYAEHKFLIFSASLGVLTVLGIFFTSWKFICFLLYIILIVALFMIANELKTPIARTKKGKETLRHHLKETTTWYSTLFCKISFAYLLSALWGILAILLCLPHLGILALLLGILLYLCILPPFFHILERFILKL